MSKFEADPDDTELTTEEREATGKVRAGPVGEALRALDRATEGYGVDHRYSSTSPEFIESLLALRSSGLKRADLGMKAAAAQANRERAEMQRRVDDSENFKLMAGILVQMEKDREDNQESRKKQATFNTIMAVVGGVLALGGIAVPFIIEAMKGWK